MCRVGGSPDAGRNKGCVLKGAAWLFDGSLVPPFDRMMEATDLLVASEQIEAAVTTLVSAGYRDTCDSVVEKPICTTRRFCPREAKLV